MLLTYRKLVDLCSEGVVENYKQSAINAASIDVHLGEKIYLPKRSNIKEIDLVNDKSNIDQFFESYRIEGGGFLLDSWQFWLGSTVEKFNLPDNIAAEYKLKSSQARLGQNHLLAGWCLTGDTKIDLLDGSQEEIRNLVGKEFQVYSVDGNGDVKSGSAYNVHISKYVDEIVEVELDNGKVIRSTGDHRFMLRNGEYLEAEKLIPGTTLMPLKKKISNTGYEQVYSPSTRLKSNWKTLIGKWEFTHQIVVGKTPEGMCIHHKNHNKLNNRVDNLEVIDAIEHAKLHRDIYSKSEIGRLKSSENMSKIMKEKWSDREYRECKSKQAVTIANSTNKKRWIENREKSVLNASRLAKENKSHLSMHEWNKANKEEHKKKTVAGCVKKVLIKLIESNMKIDLENYLSTKKQNFPTKTKIEEYFGSFSNLVKELGYNNHYVVSVKKVKFKIAIPVYDMTVDKYHNFGLSSGVFVHNCDPGWNNSKLTMEFVNYLPFPARIYAGMPIGQIVFWEGEKVPEKQSYSKRGRYNNQKTTQISKGIYRV